jgi:hypothetical protein
LNKIPNKKKELARVHNTLDRSSTHGLLAFKQQREQERRFVVVVVYVVVVVSWEEDFAAREKNTRCGKRAEEQNYRNDFVVVESAEWCVV